MRLPVDAIIPQVLATLSKGSPVVVTAPPGSGKTTRIPPALLQDIEGRILVSQPRRIAARSAARRMAEESGTPLGEVFG